MAEGRDNTASRPPSLGAKVAAWGVHVFTVSGAVMGLLAVQAIIGHQWRSAFFWMAGAIAVDALDGALARAAKVKEVLPEFDGALLDNIVDFFTYVVVPAVFLHEAELLPDGFALAGAIGIFLASSYQFCQSDAKTDDHFFKGFPSYWNITVFYLFLLEMNPWVNLAILAFLCLAVFVPIKYLYPSRTRWLRTVTLALTFAWAIALLVVLAQYPRHPPWLLLASFVYIAYYFLASITLTIITWRQQANRQRLA